MVQSTGHPLVVKLDTIKPDKAEVYCYACDKMVDDGEKLGEHLATFGMDLATQVATGKSLTQQMIDASKNLDLSAVRAFVCDALM